MLANNSKYKSIFICFVLALLLELTLFNFRYYQSKGYKAVKLQQPTLYTGLTKVGPTTYKADSEECRLEFYDIDSEVQNIYFDLQSTYTPPTNATNEDMDTYDKSRRILVRLCINDKSYSGGIVMPKRNIVATVESTKYIPVILSGKSDRMQICFEATKGMTYDLKHVVLNKPKPFDFRVSRVFGVFVLLILVAILRPGSKYYHYTLNTDSLKQRILIITVIVMQITCVVKVSGLNTKYVRNVIIHQWQYNELAEALLDGQLYLNTEPDENLQYLNNPYDPWERDTADVKVAWDHAYRNGKYYVYFGIVPCLVFNIIAVGVFHRYISPHACIVLMLPWFIIMSWLLLYRIARCIQANSEKGIPLLIYMITTTTFVMCTGLVYALEWPDLYTVPIFMALVLAVSGLYCWMSADGERLSGCKLFLGSLLISLIGGCRPQLLLLEFLAIPIFAKTVFRERRLFSKDSIVETVSFIAPILITALFLAWYNYARFGSIFDFGANYNLTTNDMTVRGIKLGRVAQGIFAYFLQPIALQGKFPYITLPNADTGFMGITVTEGNYGAIFSTVPMTLVLVFLPKVKQALKERKVYAITLLLLIFGIVIACADAVIAGILPRYTLDFYWMIVLSAIMLIYSIYYHYNGKSFWRVIEYTIPLCFFVSMLIALGTYLGVTIYPIAETNPTAYWNIVTAIQFWL